MKTICIFCPKEIKIKSKKKYGICTSCKINILRTIKKREYNLLVKGEDVKLVTGRLVKELKGQGYKVIK